jgi:plasmid stabilization system protein ParE
MARYIEAPLAKQDLAAIIRRIADDNPDAAQQFLAQIMELYQLIAENNLMGRLWPALAPKVRVFPFGDYLIVYRPIPDCHRTCASRQG